MRGAADWDARVEEPNGNTHMVYFYVFEDSHRTAQFNLGYSWSTYWGERDGLQAGLGWTAFIVQRPDIASGWPIPGRVADCLAALQESQCDRHVHPDAQRRREPRQHAVHHGHDRLAVAGHERTRHRRWRARACPRVEDRAVAARRQGVRRAGQRRHCGRAGPDQRRDHRHSRAGRLRDRRARRPDASSARRRRWPKASSTHSGPPD